LGYGLAAILALIGAKLVLHWAHKIWPGVPEIPTLLSLGIIVGILAVVTITSLIATAGKDSDSGSGTGSGHAAHPAKDAAPTA
jgi:predicted tellurium resistance membrane protein TerC